MKKTLYSILAIAATLSLTMCAKNELKSAGENNIKADEKVTIGVGLSANKVVISQGDGALSPAWQEGDQLRVEGQTCEVYDIVAGYAPQFAEFTGNYAGEGNKNVYFPAKYATSKALGERSYTNQVQTGNGSTAHLEFNALASNLEDITEVNLTPDGAKVNQAVKFVVKFPAGVTTVDSLILQAPSALFYTTNEGSQMTDRLVLKFKDTDVSGAKQVLTAYIMTSWKEMNIPSGTAFQVKVVTAGQSEECCFSLTATTKQAYKWVGGNTFTFDMSSKELEHKVKGTGTQADPYQLCDAYDLTQMNGLMKAGSKIYFKLMADVDMTGFNWVGPNQTSPYSEKIDFDGCDHTISNLTSTKDNIYGGLIGVLSGRVANVTFVNPVIVAAKNAGIVCGYAGTEGTDAAIIKNVTIVNGSITQTALNHVGLIWGHSNVEGCELTDITVSGTVTQKGNGYSGMIFGAQNIKATLKNVHATGTLLVADSAPIAKTKAASGGIAGYSCGSSFENCSFEGTINGARLCGGIVGYEKTGGAVFKKCSVNATLNVKRVNNISSEVVGGVVGYLQGGTIENCCTKGTIIALDQTAGGIAGNIVSLSTIKNCFSTITIGNNRNYGGIAARAAADSWGISAEKTLEVEKCIYWGTKIDCGQATTSNGSSGSIVGFTTVNNVLKDCWRINDSKFTFVNTKNTANKPVDQPNNVPGTSEKWTVGTTPQVGTSTYSCPYWGKAAAADATASSVAKTLGWDETIWDLAGDEPKLK